MINKPSPEELERGFSECKECDQGVYMHQAGYEVETHICSLCKCHVADRDEFFKFQTGIEVMSK